MKKFILVSTLVFIQSTFAAVVDLHPIEKKNYYICKTKLLKDGKELKQNLITTYHPQKGVLQRDVNYSAVKTQSSRCVYRPFYNDYNKDNVHFDKDENAFIDICFKIANGIYEGVSGRSEFYLSERRNTFSLNHLNLGSPLQLQGTEAQEITLKGYTLKVSCEDKMLLPTDQIWSKISKHRNIK